MRCFLVSGACGGLGFAVTEALALRGARVFAADCSAEGLSGRAWPAGVEALPVDVRDSASVARGVGAVRESLGAEAGLDGLVCCAGVFTGGPLVEAGEDALALGLDVNVMGAYRLVKEAFPLLVRSRGTIVLISSESARFAMPFNGPYTIGKRALEAYADCLRRELYKTGVKVAVIQPGAIRTDLLRNAAAGMQERTGGSAFAGPLSTVRRLLGREWDKAMEAEKAAGAVVRALYAKRPRPRYRIGNNPLHVILRFFPARIADALVAKFL